MRVRVCVCELRRCSNCLSSLAHPTHPLDITAVCQQLRTLAPGNLQQYTAFQRLISKDYGETHFQAARNPWNYLFALLFTAQFERAVDFLQRVDLELAVHLALPLRHYGALRSTPDISENTRACVCVLMCVFVCLCLCMCACVYMCCVCVSLLRSKMCGRCFTVVCSLPLPLFLTLPHHHHLTPPLPAYVQCLRRRM